MNSKDYWAKRSVLDMARYMRTAEQTAALMEQTGKAAADYINSLIKGVFTGFEGFGISETEARNILSAGNNRTALQRLRAAASRVTDPKKRQALTDAINSAGAYRYRIDRLEEIGRQITEQCNSLYQTQLSAVRSCLGGVASGAYYRSIFNIQQRTGLGFSFALFPKSQVEQLLSKHWCGASYSQRLWKDTDILADRPKDELLIGLLSGRSGEKTARVIREQFGNNAYCARRLVRTESAYVSNAAALSGYGEAGIDRYISVATLDQKTSEVCVELDGQSFLRSEAKAGTNLPPMHPFCRSTTIADFGEDTLKNLERRAKDKDGNTVTVPADMKYSEWRERFVDGNKVLTNGAGDGIIKPEGVANLEQAKTRDKKIDITDVAISKADPPIIPGFTDEQNEEFKRLHHELLRTSKEENDSNEVAFLFNPTTLTYEKELGSERSVNVFANPLAVSMMEHGGEKELYLIHNHPTTKNFSYSDIGTFLMYDNIGGMTAITNSGVVHTIYKNNKYDYDMARNIIREIRSEFPQRVLNEAEDAEVVKRFLKRGSDCGIVSL